MKFGTKLTIALSIAIILTAATITAITSIFWAIIEYVFGVSVLLAIQAIVCVLGSAFVAYMMIAIKEGEQE